MINEWSAITTRVEVIDLHSFLKTRLLRYKGPLNHNAHLHLRVCGSSKGVRQHGTSTPLLTVLTEGALNAVEWGAAVAEVG